MNVIIDNCVLDELALLEINPAAQIAGTEFTLRTTPDLRTEYQDKLKSSAALPSAKDLAKSILDESKEIGFFGFSEANSPDGGPFVGFGGLWASKDQINLLARTPQKPRARKLPKNRTDSHLSALSQHAIVITNDEKGSHWKNPPQGFGKLIFWSELKKELEGHGDLPRALREIMRSRSI